VKPGPGVAQGAGAGNGLSEGGVDDRVQRGAQYVGVPGGNRGPDLRGAVAVVVGGERGPGRRGVFLFLDALGLGGFGSVGVDDLEPSVAGATELDGVESQRLVEQGLLRSARCSAETVSGRRPRAQTMTCAWSTSMSPASRADPVAVQVPLRLPDSLTSRRAVRPASSPA